VNQKCERARATAAYRNRTPTDTGMAGAPNGVREARCQLTFSFQFPIGAPRMFQKGLGEQQTKLGYWYIDQIDQTL
jgi:hypothetical protein